jgi:hypothetical protein
MRLPILLLLLVGCGPNDPRDIFGVHPDLQPYFTEFEQAYGMTIGDIAADYGQTEFPVVGVCKVWVSKNPLRTRDFKQIVINKDYWDRATRADKRNLILHELGHCRLDRDHDDGIVEAIDSAGNKVTIAKSLMTPYVMPRGVFQQFYNYYLQELFQNHAGIPALRDHLPGDPANTVVRTHSCSEELK